MYQYVIDHAIRSVWCTPNQDRQSIVKPVRITPINGVRNKTRVMLKTINLPVTGVNFHIYQVGNIHPALIGLFNSVDKWESIESISNREKVIVDFYNDAGIQYPRFAVWYRYTSDGNLIFAIQQQPKLAIDFNGHPIYIRFYSNAYFNSRESDPLDDYIKVRGLQILEQTDILSLQTEIQIRQALPGHVYCYINGMLTDSITLLNTNIGDVAEFIHDTSIYKVIDLPVSSLPNFTSTIDNKEKYLIHPSGTTEKIDHYDDIDFFLINKNNLGKFKGLLYHKNHADSVRMVTHRDYAIVVQYLMGLVSTQSTWTNPEELTVRLHIRNSGYNRSLVNEVNRIKELYKLTDTDLVAAMTGVNAVIPNWTAANLEASAYTDIMEDKITDITLTKVENAYGYNALSVILGDTPRKTTLSSGRKAVTMPYGLIENSTVYEFNSDGVLLDFHNHVNGDTYVCTSGFTDMVEAISGIGGTSLDDVYGQDTQTLDPLLDYRMYKCVISLGTPSDIWEDVTDSGDYALINNQLTWLIDTANYYTMVRSNKKFLAYHLEITPELGSLRFSLDQVMDREGLVSTWVMQVPMGRLEVFLNGYNLIEGLDYYVDFPRVVIINKEYLVTPELGSLQRVTVRATSFCRSNLQMDPSAEFGFIRHELVSNNNRFDIRDDRVLRFVVDGRLKHRNDIRFSEDNSPNLTWLGNNGKPYQINDIVVPLRHNSINDTYALRDQARAVDSLISDYLTLKKPDEINNFPNVIPNRYTVFSPFLCKLIYELVSGRLNDPRLYGFVDDSIVAKICRPYEWLLQFDPTQDGLQQDDRYVEVHPHNLFTVISLTQHHYVFLLKVIKLYLHNRVSLTGHVTISEAIIPVIPETGTPLISRPTLTGVSGPEIVSIDVLYAISTPFSANAPNTGTHVSSDWEIYMSEVVDWDGPDIDPDNGLLVVAEYLSTSLQNGRIINTGLASSDYIISNYWNDIGAWAGYRLNSTTTYPMYVRTRHYDSNGNVSRWSPLLMILYQRRD